MTIELDGVNNTLKTDKIEPQSGTTLTVGTSGDTVTVPSGVTFDRTIDWQTGDVKTSTFTAAAGKGYLVDTTSSAITVNLPAGSAGAQVAVVDYAGTWDSNSCTLAPNGSEKIEGLTQDVALSNKRDSIVLLYQDSTQGWIGINNSDGQVASPTYISATGGTITTSGDFKIHTFTSSGTFTVSSVGNSIGGGDGVSYLVLAGGGGGGSAGTRAGGGGGAGGFREGKNSGDPYTASPLNAPSGLTVSAQGYPITVGAGNASVFSTITSAGGGTGGIEASNIGNGGSGGGAGAAVGPGAQTGGSGNTPPVSPPQGNDGGDSVPSPGPSKNAGGGGGGAGAAGGDAPTPGGDSGTGGAGATSSITGSPVQRGGGGGGSGQTPPAAGGAGGGGGGSGPTNNPSPGNNGTANQGGGGGAGGPGGGGDGGSGTVIIRYKYQN